MNGCIEPMIEALSAEIAAIKKQGATKNVNLTSGKLISEEAGCFLYRFIVPDDVLIREDTPIKIKVAHVESEGEVVSVGDGFVTISCKSNLGPHLAAVTLIIDDSYLLQRLKSKFAEVKSSPLFFALERANRVISGRSTIAPLDKFQRKSAIPTQLNEKQHRALVSSLTGDLSFIWGPPGTGKTKCIAEIVEELYLSGQTVLLISNTNMAVDTALEMTCKRLIESQDSAFMNGRVLRIGKITKPELETEYAEYVSIEKILEKKAAPLKAKISELENSLIKNQKLRDGIKEMISELVYFEDVTKNLKEAQRESSKINAQLARVDYELSLLRAQIDGINEKLNVADSLTPVQRYFKGINPSALQSRLKRIDAKIIRAEEEKAKANLVIAEINGREGKYQVLAATMEAKISAYPSVEECKKELSACESELAKTTSYLEALRKELAKLEEELLANCRVIACTAYKAYLDPHVWRAFDAVVVDEASMLILPLVYICSGLSSKRVIVSGDFKQLPPIVIEKSEQANLWLKRDVFVSSGIAEAADSKKGHETVPLTV